MTKLVDDSIKKRLSELKMDVIYCKKGHYNAAAIWNSVHYLLGIATTTIAALIGVKHSSMGSGTIAFLATLTAVLGALSTFLKPQDRANQHKQSGDDFDHLLQQIFNFNEVGMLIGSDNEHSLHLQGLTDQKTKLNKDSLQIPRLAYLMAKKGYKKGEASYDELGN